jgi:glycosyltransferase involved in cell wall biosynthesis
LYLRTARLLGYRIVWTAHNVLPHAPVFFDDVAARRTLIHWSSAVIALSQTSVAELEELGAEGVRVIPFGSYGGLYSTTHDRDRTREMFGLSPGDLAVLLIGKIERYKGADCLLDAAVHLGSSTNIRIIVAGECTDSQYRSTLSELAHAAHERALVELNLLSDESMAQYLNAADFAVFPYRKVTNSSSILLAMSYGLPVILPRLPQFDDAPEQAAIRYDATAPNGLAEALLEAASRSAPERAAMGSAARSYADSLDWSAVSKATEDLYLELLNQ